jgi:hypothetical protein
MLLVVVIHNDRLQVFGFHDQTAIEALDIIYAVTTGNDNSTVMLTNRRDGLRGLHKANYGLF